MPDGMELEFLDIEFRKRYGLLLSEIWREDLTLGELFSLRLDVRRRQVTRGG